MSAGREESGVLSDGLPDPGFRRRYRDRHLVGERLWELGHPTSVTPYTEEEETARELPDLRYLLRKRLSDRTLSAPHVAVKPLDVAVWVLEDAGERPGLELIDDGSPRVRIALGVGGRVPSIAGERRIGDGFQGHEQGCKSSD